MPTLLRIWKKNTCLSKLQVDTGSEVEKNIGSGITNSIVFNKGKWYISGILNSKNVIYRLNSKLQIELIDNSDILFEDALCIVMIKSFICLKKYSLCN